MTVVEDAFSAMVDQFKDPLAFLRELIQNALDAGSTTIAVTVSADAKHMVTLEVQDTGDGMDREIIETKLTRLFASSKDGDATKIGKFGVGFSSTFSIRPQAVVVDTARGAERWRVVFAPDGTWKLYTLDEAIEGTRVRVLKKVASPQEAVQLIDDARTTVLKWCRFADAQIDFNGVPIAMPFTVASPIVVRVPGRAPGDVLVVGLANATAAPSFSGAPGGQLWGFYNKGLTLMEGWGAFDRVPPWTSFRARDGAIEHTITRDNVMRDDAFERVMRDIDRAARGALLDAAVGALETGAGPDGAALTEAELAFIRLSLEPAMRQGELDKARATRKIFRDPRGAGLSLVAVRSAAKARTLRRVDAAGPLADALEKSGAVVVRAPAHSGEGALLELAGGPKELAHADYVAIVAAAEREQWDAAPLVSSIKALLAPRATAAANAKGDAKGDVKGDVKRKVAPKVAHKVAPPPELARIGDVIVARIDDRTGDLTQVPAVVVTDASLPVERVAARAPFAALAPPSRKSKAKGASANAAAPYTLVLNLASPPIADALALANSDVWLAAFLALRTALPPAPIADGATALAAWEARST